MKYLMAVILVALLSANVCAREVAYCSGDRVSGAKHGASIKNKYSSTNKRETSFNCYKLIPGGGEKEIPVENLADMYVAGWHIVSTADHSDYIAWYLEK